MGVRRIGSGAIPRCSALPSCVSRPSAPSVRVVDARTLRLLRSTVFPLRDLGPREERTFRVRFTPRYALDVVTAPSQAYEYYVPEEAILVAPQPVRAVR